jgi:hypothetical protein
MPTDENKSDNPNSVDGEVSGVARMLTETGRCPGIALSSLAAGMVNLPLFWWFCLFAVNRKPHSLRFIL